MDWFCYCDHILGKVHSWLQFDQGMKKQGEEITVIILWTPRSSHFPNLSPPPFPAVSSIGIEAERRKNRAGKRERSTRGSAVEITQKWCLLPHKWNNKKVFKYRTGSTSSEVNLLCQRVTTITKHYFWPLGLSNMFREVYTTKVDDFSERDSGSFPLLI